MVTQEHEPDPIVEKSWTVQDVEDLEESISDAQNAVDEVQELIADWRRLTAQNSAMADVLEGIAVALDVPRNRFGKLMGTSCSGDLLRGLAVKYEVGGCTDTSEQAMKVARAVLAKAGR